MQVKVAKLDGKPIDRASVFNNFVKGRSTVKDDDASGERRLAELATAAMLRASRGSLAI